MIRIDKYPNERLDALCDIRASLLNLEFDCTTELGSRLMLNTIQQAMSNLIELVRREVGDYI